MAFVQGDLDTLDRVIAAGELTVRFADGKTITYRSTTDLLRARSTIKGELDAAANAGTAPPRATFMTYRRG